MQLLLQQKSDHKSQIFDENTDAPDENGRLDSRYARPLKVVWVEVSIATTSSLGRLYLSEIYQSLTNFF